MNHDSIFMGAGNVVKVVEELFLALATCGLSTLADFFQRPQKMQNGNGSNMTCMIPYVKKQTADVCGFLSDICTRTRLPRFVCLCALGVLGVLGVMCCMSVVLCLLDLDLDDPRFVCIRLFLCVLFPCAGAWLRTWRSSQVMRYISTPPCSSSF